MLKVERISVMNFDNAIRGARNPMNSWEKSDSYYDENGKFVMGPADLDFGHRLAVAGSDHRKFLRMIFVSMDITAPLYWWKEFDTYKVGTVANSTSTMHKIHAKPITAEDFSVDHLTLESAKFFGLIIDYLESVRLEYMQTKDKALWYDLITMLPESYEQTRTVTMNYENLVNMYHARKNHKLDEWHTFCEDFVLNLPYAKDLIVIKDEE